MSAEEQSLAIVALAYIGGVFAWAWIHSVRADILLRDVAARVDPQLWQALGAPTSMKDVINDPGRRWTQFIRTGEYKRRCSDEVIDLIDEHQRRLNWMLVVLLSAGALIAFRYWPLLTGL